MALPPDTGETFLREVDENLRRDQMSGLARKYGGWVIAAVVLLLAAAGGYLFWQDQQRKAAATDSEALSQIYTDIGTGKVDKVGPPLDALAADGTDAVRATALFTSAAVAMKRTTARRRSPSSMRSPTTRTSPSRTAISP